MESTGQEDLPEIRPRTKSRTSDPRECLDLAIGKGRLQDLEPITVGHVFKKTVKEIPDVAAMMFQDSPDGEWQSISYAKYYELVVQASKSFIHVSFYVKASPYLTVHVLLIEVQAVFPRS